MENDFLNLPCEKNIFVSSRRRRSSELMNAGLFPITIKAFMRRCLDLEEHLGLGDNSLIWGWYNNPYGRTFSDAVIGSKVIPNVVDYFRRYNEQHGLEGFDHFFENPSMSCEIEGEKIPGSLDQIVNRGSASSNRFLQILTGSNLNLLDSFFRLIERTMNYNYGNRLNFEELENLRLRLVHDGFIEIYTDTCSGFKIASSTFLDGSIYAPVNIIRALEDGTYRPQSYDLPEQPRESPNPGINAPEISEERIPYTQDIEKDLRAYIEGRIRTNNKVNPPKFVLFNGGYIGFGSAEGYHSSIAYNFYKDLEGRINLPPRSKWILYDYRRRADTIFMPPGFEIRGGGYVDISPEPTVEISIPLRLSFYGTSKGFGDYNRDLLVKTLAKAGSNII